MSCGGSNVTVHLGSGCGGYSVSVPSHCVYRSEDSKEIYISGSCGSSLSGEFRWVNGGCGQGGYYERKSSGC